MSIDGILKFLLICLEVVLLFNLLIIVHELGHFLAARWRGLVVEKFAIWFGAPIWSKTIGGVEYRLGWIPAGGFVAIPQMAPMEALEGKSEAEQSSLPAASAMDKVIVAAAGPLFSLGLAFVMASVVWWVGKPESEFDMPRIGFLKPGAPAERAGLKVGDEILEVDGHPVKKFLSGTQSVKWRIIRSEGESIIFKVRRDGEILEIPTGWTKPETEGWRRPALREVGIGPHMPPGVQFVIHGSPAEAAGLRGGDLILEAGGKRLFNLDELVPIVQEHYGRRLDILVEREGREVALVMEVPRPAVGQEEVDLGIFWGRIRFMHPDPFTQVAESATSIFRMLEALFSPRSDVKAAHFSGPVGILRLYYQVFESDYGWRLALALSVLINVNLAILNLLPFPVLDGGHIVLALVEMVRRKPINIKVLEALQTACALLLIAFMLYVTFFDVGDLIAPEKGRGSPEPTPVASDSP